MWNRVAHLFQTHRRAALVIMLGASAVTLSGTLMATLVIGEMERNERILVEDNLMKQQEVLEQRIATIEEERLASRVDLVGYTPAQQIESEDEDEEVEVGVDEANSRSPFPMDRIVSSIVDLICIDNNDSETYYSASGTVIDSSGNILTNSHILASADGSLIRFCGVGFTTNLREAPLIEYVATAHTLHKDADLAILRITERLDGGPLPERFTSVTIGNGDGPYIAPSLGETIFIGGYPGIGADTFTFTQGVVSGHVGANLIKTSALIDSGTSGGAAFDSRGRYIGVPTAAVPGDIGGSLGYLIASSVVETFLSDYYDGVLEEMD